MPRRSLVVCGLSLTVFVGVLLLLVSTPALLVQEVLPAATLSALVTAVISWRWSAHLD